MPRVSPASQAQAANIPTSSHYDIYVTLEFIVTCNGTKSRFERHSTNQAVHGIAKRGECDAALVFRRPDVSIDAAQALVGFTWGAPATPPYAALTDAKVAEMPYTAFASRRSRAITARLIVRRVKDLNSRANQALRDVLARYVQAARRAGGSTRRPAHRGRPAPAAGVDSTEIREWAKARGIEVKDRGCVPAELVVKFKAATGQ